MVTQVKCVLTFERKDPVFFSGEQIKGIVHLESESELTCFHSKHIELIGVCEINWNEKKKNFKHSGRFYFNWFWDLEEITDNAATENKFFKQKLKFQLPLINQLPTSCKAKYGFIEYNMVFIMQQFKKHESTVELKYTQPITVIRTLNPNDFALYEEPWQLDPIPILSCTINRTSFAPGESVPYILKLKKHFLLHFIKSITISLQEVIEYHPEWFSKCKKFETRHTLDQCDICIQNSTHKQYAGKLNVPKTIVTSFNYPIYLLYKHYFPMKIRHVINITVNGRFTFKFKNSGYDKLITIATVPMIKHSGEAIICDTSKKEVEKSRSQHHFECLPCTSSSISPNIAFIPKYSIKEETYNLIL